MTGDGAEMPVLQAPRRGNAAPYEDDATSDNGVGCYYATNSKMTLQTVAVTPAMSVRDVHFVARRVANAIFESAVHRQDTQTVA